MRLRGPTGDSARDLWTEGYDESTGFGMVDALGAVRRAERARDRLRPTAAADAGT